LALLKEFDRHSLETIKVRIDQRLAEICNSKLHGM
jgi:hypothetical protein